MTCYFLDLHESIYSKETKRQFYLNSELLYIVKLKTLSSTCLETDTDVAKKKKRRYKNWLKI